MAKRYCPNCGSLIADGSKYCVECGSSVSESEMSVSARSGRERKKGKGKKALIVILCIILVLITILASLYYIGSKYIYSENFRNCIFSIMESAADVENAGNMVQKVWANSIYRTSDIETDKYTRADGGLGDFYPEFDTASDALFSEGEFISTLQTIASQKNDITALMKQLSNPPSSFASDYNDLKEMYACYLEFADIVLNTSGSLESFSASFGSADENLLKAYYHFSVYIT